MANELIKKSKENLRIIDNYNIPDETKISSIVSFFTEVINWEYNKIQVLNEKLQSIFNVLCEDIIRQCKEFIASPNKNLDKAKNLLNIILSTEQYFAKIEKLPWKIGRKLSHLEKINIRRIFRKKLHSLYDEKSKKPVRGTKVIVILAGSLAGGYSDWKLIDGGNIPKPTDYGIPREYRKEKSIYKKLDIELNLPMKLKPKMSDVDIVIVNEVIYKSLNSEYSENGWYFRLGEKYPTGIGASPILEKIHQALSNTKIGGIRGRWVNYIVLKNEEDYQRYMKLRLETIEKIEKRIGKKIKISDIKILNEIIS